MAKDLRDDQFWAKNFLSILKLRNTDKNGIKYIARSMDDYRSKTKPIGYNKIKGIIEYYIYTSPATGQKELGAKTKGGELYEFNIKADAPYMPLLHNQPLFSELPKALTPNADKLSQSHISLPVHMLIKEDDARFIAKSLIEVLS